MLAQLFLEARYVRVQLFLEASGKVSVGAAIPRGLVSVGTAISRR